MALREPLACHSAGKAPRALAVVVCWVFFVEVVGAPPAIDVGIFAERGFVVLRAFSAANEIEKLRNALDASLEAWEPPHTRVNASLSLRIAQQQSGLASGVDYSFLLGSATEARFFLESNVIDASSGSMRPGLSKRMMVRKVGHGVHLHEGPFRDFVKSRKVAEVPAELGYQSPVVVQTVYRICPPFAPGVERHQDSTTLYTDPPSVLGLWLALEDTDEANGCLQVIPGSHRGPLWERFVRRPSAGGAVNLVFEPHPSSKGLTPPKQELFECVVMSAGDLLVMHGTLEHFSASGKVADRSRDSFQIHIAESSARWAQDNWLQYPDGMAFLPIANVSTLSAAHASEL